MAIKRPTFYKLGKNFKNKIHKDKKANKTSDFLKEAKNFFSKNGLYLTLAGTYGFISPFLIKALIFGNTDGEQGPEIERNRSELLSSENEENRNSEAPGEVKPKQEVTKDPQDLVNDSDNTFSGKIKDETVKQEVNRGIEENTEKKNLLKGNMLFIAF